mgnify:CR=1 FL=1
MFGFGKKQGDNTRKRARSVLPVTMLTCAAFVALAIYGWGLPLATAGKYLLITFVLLTVVIGAALLVGFIWNWARRLLG